MNEKYSFVNDIAKDYITKELEKVFLTKYHDMNLLSRCYEEIDLLYDRGLLFIIEALYKYKNNSKDKSYRYYFGGSCNNLLLLYVLGLSSVNPLPRHFYCSDCKSISYIEGVCSKCGLELEQDGYNLPSELFNAKSKIMLSLVDDLLLSYDFLDRKFDLPFTAVFCPDDLNSKSIADFNDKKYLLIPFGDIPDAKFSLDESGYMLLSDYDKAIFKEYKSIIVSPIRFSKRCSKCDFKSLLTTDFEKKVAKKLKPISFDDYVKIKSLAHSTNVWNENEEYLCENGLVDIHNIISNREDVFEYLLEHDIPIDLSVKITNFIANGKPSRFVEEWNKYIGIMKKYKIEKSFIDICSKILYLTYRGNSISECLSILNEDSCVLK